MSGSLLKKVVPPALSLVLGLALSNANGAAVNIAGGSSATVGGWQITTDAGFVATGVSTASDTLTIQNTAITFSDGDPKGITFTQISADAVPFIDIQTATIGNATASDWTGFQFALSGAGSFDGISDLFVPPLSLGVNYTSVDLNAPRTLVSYAGSQVAGSTSSWGSSNPGDDLLTDGNPEDSAPFASFALDESPQGFISEVVPVPAAAWQSLAGLLALGFIPAARKAVKIFA